LSAFVFGVFGWFCSDAIVERLLVHRHASGVLHVHHRLAAAAIVVVFLLAAVSLAIATTSAWRPSALARAARVLGAGPGQASLLSTLGFMVAEWIQRGPNGDGVPSPDVVVIGCLVQAFVTLGGALVWRAGIATLDLRIGFLLSPSRGVQRQKRWPASHQPGFVVFQWVLLRLAGRAPPIASV
jgi:hypothetical protein